MGLLNFGVHVGAIDKTVDWKSCVDLDPEDEELAVTPPDVVAALGFDPLDEKDLEEGSASSGNFGHAGRPGEVGGSGPGGSIDAGGELEQKASHYSSFEAFAADHIHVHHGTVADFGSFQMDRFGDENSIVPDRFIGPHFAVDKAIADTFSQKASGGVTKELFLDIQKPYDLPQEGEAFDQSAFQTDIARQVFPVRKDLFVKYWSNSRRLPEEEVSRLYDEIKAGKTAAEIKWPETFTPADDEPNVFAALAKNNGMLLFHTEERKEFIVTYRSQLKAQGYDSIRYINTSPMETKGLSASERTCYVALTADIIKTEKELRRIYNKAHKISEGSASSGNFGHAGRPGEVGGSGPGGGGSSVDAGATSLKDLSSPGNIAKSLEIAGKQHAEHLRDWRERANRLPEGTSIKGWIKTTIGKDVLWVKNNRTGVADVVVEVGDKAVEKAFEVADRERLLKPSRTPTIIRGADRTESSGDTIFLGRDLDKSQENTFLKHEMLHVAFYDHEDKWKSVGIKNLGNTKIGQMHPRFEQYDDRAKSGEDFTTSAAEWVSGDRFAQDIRRGWITKEEAESRMRFFDSLASKKKHESIAEGSASSGNFGHAGRPGEVGGSGPGGGSSTVSAGATGTKAAKRAEVDKILASTGKTKKQIEDEFGKRRVTGHTLTDAKRIATGVPEEVKNRRQEFPDGTAKVLHALAGPTKVDKPAGIQVSSDTFQQRQGKCYDIASDFIRDNDGWTLVHAALYPRIGQFQDKIYFHGFAEKGDMVYDPVFDRFYDKKSYYKYYSITDERRYDATEALKRMLKERNYGPWD